MMKFSRMTGIMALALCLSLLVGVSNVALAQGPGCGPNGGGPFGDLSSEQRDAILDKVMEMRSQGATREEIRTTVSEMLKGYGIEVTEEWRGPMVFGHGPGGGFEANLTDEQREALREEIEKLRGRGASDLEIQVAVAEILEDYGVEPPGLLGKLTDEQRAAVQQKIKLMLTQGADHKQVWSEITEMIEGFGIEMPDDRHGPFGLGHRKGGFMADLTEEQREVVREKMKEMRDLGATREETHTVVAEMLKSYGIEVPEDWPGPRGFGHRRGGFMSDLTEEQREAVREKMKEMRDQGATPEETHTAVAEILKGYGIEVPEPHGPFGFMADLTEEQREAVREKMKEMRDQGVTREEIRAAVDEMLEEYGVKLSEDDQSVSSEVESAESYITAQSYPNPFNPEAEIAYTLSVSENVRIQIYNVSGQLIRTFDMGYQPAGSYSVRWDGRNESGDATASGVYLYRIEAGPYQVNNRMILLK